MGLYERIRDIAKEKGYSINRLEKELGFARSSINKFNTNTPGLDKIRQIAELLGVSVDYLTGEEKEGGEAYYMMDLYICTLQNFIFMKMYYMHAQSIAIR